MTDTGSLLIRMRQTCRTTDTASFWNRYQTAASFLTQLIRRSLKPAKNFFLYRLRDLGRLKKEDSLPALMKKTGDLLIFERFYSQIFFRVFRMARSLLKCPLFAVFRIDLRVHSPDSDTPLPTSSLGPYEETIICKHHVSVSNFSRSSCRMGTKSSRVTCPRNRPKADHIQSFFSVQGHFGVIY